jgi:hypothetical protein
VSSRAIEAIDRILGLGSDPDDALRAVTAELVREPTIEWAGILFLDNGALVPGPEAGAADPSRRTSVRVSYQDATVGELAIDGVADRAFLERVASLISTHVLLGWDTGGTAWEP